MRTWSLTTIITSRTPRPTWSQSPGQGLGVPTGIFPPPHGEACPRVQVQRGGYDGYVTLVYYVAGIVQRGNSIWLFPRESSNLENIYKLCRLTWICILNISRTSSKVTVRLTFKLFLRGLFSFMSKTKLALSQVGCYWRVDVKTSLI